ncbi:MAG: PQQ-binding-like beta-propeller repeat protein [Deltaproteobacteria bacterium]|nr:PQQ-binding-like beta-propeller repeat protein [Deltaproteobacteria bacterium]
MRIPFNVFTFSLLLLLTSASAAFGARKPPTRTQARPHLSRDLRAIVDRALTLETEHRDKEALPLLRRAIKALRPNAMVTSWASMTAGTENAAALGTHITLTKTRAITFTSGRFTAFDRATGQALWHFDADWAEPNVTETTNGPLLIITQKALIALDPNDGRVQWRASMNEPAPEIAESPDHAAVLVADENELRALAIRDGALLWHFDPRLALAAGPVATETDVVIAAGTKVFTLQATDGTPRHTISLGDEISSPLIAAQADGHGRIWAMVGSDEVVLVDAKQGTVAMRAAGLRAAAWPATAAGDNLYIPTVRRRASGVVVVAADPSGAGTKSIAQVPAVTGPIFRVDDGPDAIALDPRRGTVVRLDGQRRRAWRAKVSPPITHAAVKAGAIFLAHGRQLDLMDASRPRVTRTLELDHEILALAVDATGGALVTRDGTLHGFAPDSGDLDALKTRAEIALAGILLRLGQAKEAARTIEPVAARSPNNLDALAVLARADAALGRERALSSWLDLATRDASTPSIRPMRPMRPMRPIRAIRAEARQALKDLAGLRIIDGLGGISLRGVARTGNDQRPQREFVTAEETILVRTAVKSDGDGNGEVAAFDTRADQIAWRLPGVEMHPAAGPYVVIEGRLVDIRKGTPTRGAPRDRQVAYVDRGVIRLTKAEGFVLETFDRPPRRLTATPGAAIEPNAVVLEASDPRVLLWSPSAPDTLEARATATGERRWRQTLSHGQKIERAVTVGPTVFAITATSGIALDAETGRPQHRATFERRDGDKVIARPDVLFTLHNDRLRVIDPLEGPHGKALTLPAPIVDVALSGPPGAPIAFIATADGRLLVFDPRQGTVERSVVVGPIQAIAAVDHAVLISLESGVVLRATTERRLQPKR